MAITTSGTVNAAHTHRRRRIATISVFSSSSAVTVLGSRAMPHLGQLPGSSRTISGCIGHVYSTRFAGPGGLCGSRAIPQSGQSPGPSWRTSGCMGQVYRPEVECEPPSSTCSSPPWS